MQHANIEGIEVRDDGTLSSESVVSVANKFREENPALVPSNNAGTITDSAPASNTLSNEPIKDVSDMSKDELRDLLSNARHKLD